MISCYLLFGMHNYFFFLHSWMRNYQHIVCVFLCINKMWIQCWFKVRVVSWRIYVHAVAKNIHWIHHSLMPRGNLDGKDNSKQGSHHFQRVGHNFYFSGFKIIRIWHSSRKSTGPKGLCQAKGVWGHVPPEMIYILLLQRRVPAMLTAKSALLSDKRAL